MDQGYSVSITRVISHRIIIVPLKTTWNQELNEAWESLGLLDTTFCWLRLHHICLIHCYHLFQLNQILLDPKNSIKIFDKTIQILKGHLHLLWFVNPIAKVIYYIVKYTILLQYSHHEETMSTQKHNSYYIVCL